MSELSSDGRKDLLYDCKEQNPNPWAGTWSAENSNILLPESFAHKRIHEYRNKRMSERAQERATLSQKEMPSSPLSQLLKDWKILHPRWQAAEPHDGHNQTTSGLDLGTWNSHQIWPNLPSWHGPAHFFHASTFCEWWNYFPVSQRAHPFHAGQVLKPTSYHSVSHLPWNIFILPHYSLSHVIPPQKQSFSLTQHNTLKLQFQPTGWDTPTGAVTAWLLEEYPIALGLGIRRLPQEGIPAWNYKYGQIPMTRKSKTLGGSQLLFSC